MKNAFVCFVFLFISSFANAQRIELDSVNNAASLTTTGNYLFVTRQTTTDPFIRIDLMNHTRTVMLSPFGVPFSMYGWKPMASADSDIFYMDSDTLFSSGDYGATWFKPPHNTMSGAYFYVQSDTFFLGEFRGLKKSIDGCQSFQSVYYESYYTNTTLHPLLVKGPYLYFSEEAGLLKMHQDSSTGWWAAHNARTNFPYLMVASGDTLIGSYHDTVFSSIDDGYNWSFVSVITGATWINELYMENGVLYAACGTGMQVSYDFGQNFLPINMGLPPGTGVTDMEVDSQFIYIATNEGTYMRPKNEFLPKSIRGTVFYDANSNGMQDSLEIGIPNSVLYNKYSGHVTITDTTGKFNVILSEPDTVVYIPAAPFYFVTPDTGYVVTAFGQSGDFAVQIDSLVHDLRVSLTPYTNSRINGETFFELQCTNAGAGYANANLRVYLDSSYQSITVNNPLAGVSADSVYWDLTIPPFSSVQLRIGAWLPPNPFLNGHLLKLIAYAGPYVMDYSIANNFDTVFQPVVAAYDPNEKIVWPEGNFDSTFINNSEFLTYVIRFQNTGTSYANDIIVKDQLSSFLDPSTFDFEVSSHDCSVSIDTLNMISFRFDNIILPDSNWSEPLSHGFVRFRIKPRTDIALGTVIENTGVIYFDFNPPVYTDTTSSIYLNSTGTLITQTDSQIPFAFPNPTTDLITIKVLNGEQIELFNSIGEVIYRSKAEGDGNYSIFLGDLKQGIYMLSISGKAGTRRSKIMKGN